MCFDQGELLFVRHPIGTKTLNVEHNVRIDFDKAIGPLFPFSLSEKLEIITEWHPWFSKEYGDNSPWGRPVLPPECLNAIMLGSINGQHARWPKYPSSDDWLIKEIGGRTPVGLFGGCEVSSGYKQHLEQCAMRVCAWW